MNDIKTIEQLRAKHALNMIGKTENLGMRNEELKLQKEYKSYVASLPANILQNGFGQAMAMELSAKGMHKQLYEHIENWLCKANDNPNSPYKDVENNNNLITAITENNQTLYIQAQIEAMAYLEWLKKFAVAYLKGE
ncbi:type III-B CRISPR module-associated protein Cmr5 [Bathymodiolus thermophilus thioautotrophic gill symbiont]|nr:type III-B CRISPR module-associated protein Cmr5 [Bathymodiolus thermophilus thioautotrophic gill symbiont]